MIPYNESFLKEITFIRPASLFGDYDLKYEENLPF